MNNHAIGRRCFKRIRLFTAVPLFAILAGFTSLSPPALANTFLVTNNNDSGPGSLRQAISDANNNPGPDTIIFDSGVNGNPILLLGSAGEDENLNGDLDILNSGDLFIQGNGAAITVIDGGGIDRVFHVCPGGGCAHTVSISGVGVQNGNVAGDGGGIKHESGILNVDRSRFRSNSASVLGGGIFNGEVLVITNSTFTDNQAQFAGGVYNQISLTINKSTFEQNLVTSYGGAIFNSSAGISDISNSTFQGNEAQFGGAIYNSVSTSGSGGTVTLSNSTLAGNRGSIDGGGILNMPDPATLHMMNTIIADSLAGGDCSNQGGLIATNINNLIEDGSCGAAFSGDPKLADLTDNGGLTETMALGLGSPAIDAGDNMTCEATDQRDVSRPQGINCDIGAFELMTRFYYLPLIKR